MRIEIARVVKLTEKKKKKLIYRILHGRFAGDAAKCMQMV